MLQNNDKEYLNKIFSSTRSEASKAIKDKDGTIETLSRQLVQAGIRHNIETGSKEVDREMMESKAQQKFYRKVLDEDRKNNLQKSKEKK